MSTEEVRVIVVPNAFDAMGYHRLIWPAEILHQRGLHVQMLNPDDPHRFKWMPTPGGKVADVTTPPCDVLVLQRVIQNRVLDFIPIWQSRGIQVVVDMDDDFTRVSPLHNPNLYRMLHDPRGEKSWQASVEACKMADRVVVATDRLRDIYGGVVVRNAIPDRYLDAYNIPPQFKCDDMFGWTGEVLFRQSDPAVVGDAFRRLVKDGWRFGIVGNGGPSARVAFNVPELPLATGSLPVDMYPYFLARLAVLAIPLSEQPFNLSKSWLTMLVAAAVGTVPVVTPHDEYKLLHEQGVGAYAHTPDEWYARIRTFLRNEDVRREKAEIGRRVAAQYTMTKQADTYYRAWVGVASTSDM